MAYPPRQPLFASLIQGMNFQPEVPPPVPLVHEWTMPIAYAATPGLASGQGPHNDNSSSTAIAYILNNQRFLICHLNPIQNASLPMNPRAPLMAVNISLFARSPGAVQMQRIEEAISDLDGSSNTYNQHRGLLKSDSLKRTIEWIDSLPLSRNKQITKPQALIESSPICGAFYLFDHLPTEVREGIIQYFIEGACKLLRPKNSANTWRSLTHRFRLGESRNLTDFLTSRWLYLKRCMSLSTLWYQVIGKFLLQHPFVTNTDGVRFLRQVKLNLVNWNFCHPTSTNACSSDYIESELGFQHTPEYFEYKHGSAYRTIDSQFTGPGLNNAEELWITPAKWDQCGHGDLPGGPTAFDGWGNQWMIQDAVRAFPKLKRLALVLGSKGDFSWMFPSSGLSLGNLTHLHLDIPLPRHFHPGTSPLTALASHSIGFTVFTTASRPISNWVTSHHLCPLLTPLAPNLELLSLGGAGAHICNRLFDAPWEKLKRMQGSLDGETGGICDCLWGQTCDAAMQLQQRLPDLRFDLTLKISAEATYRKEPFVWGGSKRYPTPDFHIAQSEVCCLGCAWHLKCKRKHQPSSGIDNSDLGRAYVYRQQASATEWVRELARVRRSFQFDPLFDVQNPYDEADYLRIGPNQWMDTAVAPPGECCGIKRGKNQKPLEKIM